MSRYDAIEKFVGRLPKDVLIHTTDKKISGIRNMSQREHMKPKGLWYGCGDSWISWTRGADFGIGKYIYLVKIKRNKMLLIKNAKELDEFENEFKAKTDFDMPGAGVMYIDWKKVDSKYSGIEICPYISSRRTTSLWYYGWDVASGCVWDSSAVDVELAGHYEDGEILTSSDKIASDILKMARLLLDQS